MEPGRHEDRVRGDPLRRRLRRRGARPERRVAARGRGRHRGPGPAGLHARRRPRDLRGRRLRRPVDRRRDRGREGELPQRRRPAGHLAGRRPHRGPADRHRAAPGGQRRRLGRDADPRLPGDPAGVVPRWDPDHLPPQRLHGARLPPLHLPLRRRSPRDAGVDAHHTRLLGRLAADRRGARDHGLPARPRRRGRRRHPPGGRPRVRVPLGRAVERRGPADDLGVAGPPDRAPDRRGRGPPGTRPSRCSRRPSGGGLSAPATATIPAPPPPPPRILLEPAASPR